MFHNALLETAEKLLSSSRGRPPQANLRRAVSTVYYAMFHCLCQNCADALVGRTKKLRSEHAWRQVYRALEHGTARSQCTKNEISKFPDDIQDFAKAFVASQEKRELADYDPASGQLTQFEVTLDIFFVYDVMKRFLATPIKDRRAFAVWVLFGKQRRRQENPNFRPIPKINL